MVYLLQLEVCQYIANIDSNFPSRDTECTYAGFNLSKTYLLGSHASFSKYANVFF